MSARLDHRRRNFLWLACAACLLLAASASAADPQAMAAELARLPRIEGWTLSADARSYGPQTLYEHIDGASELYLSYGCRSLFVAEYTDGRGGSLAVEIYRLESPVHAFGIYSQERPASGNFIPVGAEGYLEPPVLNFLAGDAYVKLSADGLGDRTPAALRELATSLAVRLGGASSLPAEISFFPAEGRVARSERFAGKDFLGYEFLRSAFTADYAVDGVRFQLFVISASSSAESDGMMRHYRQATGGDAGASSPTPHVLVRDKYNGDVALFRKGRFLGGAVRIADAALRDRYTDALRRKIPEAE